MTHEKAHIMKKHQNKIITKRIVRYTKMLSSILLRNILIYIIYEINFISRSTQYQVELNLFFFHLKSIQRNSFKKNDETTVY